MDGIHRPMRKLSALTVYLGSLLLLGCASVPAYKRGRLAEATMDPSYGESRARAHTLSISEGPEGGEMGQVSGCGCN